MNSRTLFLSACCVAVAVGGCKTSPLAILNRSKPDTQLAASETTTETGDTASASLDPTVPSDNHQISLASAKTQVGAAASTRSMAPPLRTLGPDEDLLSVIEDASGVVLLDFYADWCGPCKKQGVVLHAVEADAANAGAQIIKVNVDHHKKIAQQLNVQSLPTLMVVKDKKFVDKKLGFTKRSEIIAMLNR